MNDRLQVAAEIRERDLGALAELHREAGLEDAHRRDLLERRSRRAQDRLRARADRAPQQLEGLAPSGRWSEVGDVVPQDELERVGGRQRLRRPVVRP